MPPRKSTASNPPDDGAEPAPAPAKAHKEKDGLGVEDLTLPKSMIARLAKGVLPANTQIQKDALLAMHKSATVFVSYIASNSNDLARMGGKKTISPQDVMSALKDAELEGFLPRLEAELKKYNDTQCDKRNSYRHRVKAEKAAAAGGAAGEALDATDASLLAAQLNGVADGQEGAEGEGGERPAKKFKGEGGTVVITPGEPVDDADVEEMEEEEEDGDEGEDGEDEEEGDDDEGEEDEDDGADEAMEGVEGGETDGRGGIRDEALDDGNESD